jgi:hypothetical protein
METMNLAGSISPPRSLAERPVSITKHVPDTLRRRKIWASLVPREGRAESNQHMVRGFKSEFWPDENESKV